MHQLARSASNASSGAGAASATRPRTARIGFPGRIVVVLASGSLVSATVIQCALMSAAGPSEKESTATGLAVSEMSVTPFKSRWIWPMTADATAGITCWAIVIVDGKHT